MILTVQSDIFRLTKTEWNEWLNGNKICLNVSKTEVILFKLSRKLTDIPLKLKLNGKRLYHANSGKHLGINIDENLNWKQPVSDIDIKLNKENGILSKLRHFINMKTLKSIYHAIFDSHLYYSSLLGRKTQIQLRDYFFIKEILIYICLG